MEIWNSSAMSRTLGNRPSAPSGSRPSRASKAAEICKYLGGLVWFIVGSWGELNGNGAGAPCDQCTIPGRNRQFCFAQLAPRELLDGRVLLEDSSAHALES